MDFVLIGIIGGVAVVLLVLIGIALLASRIMDKLSETKHKSKHVAYAAFDKKPPVFATTGNFLISAFRSIKESTCFLVSFEGPAK
jgi:hypothetical protein